MDEAVRLKQARNVLLSLHKTLVDDERELYEGIHGKVNAGQFLNLLLEDDDFDWLRRFSTLIVEIDEAFDRKDGLTGEMVYLLLAKVRDLAELKDDDDYFKAKYQFALQRDPEAAGKQAELKRILNS